MFYFANLGWYLIFIQLIIKQNDRIFYIHIECNDLFSHYHRLIFFMGKNIGTFLVYSPYAEPNTFTKSFSSYREIV